MIEVSGPDNQVEKACRKEPVKFELIQRWSSYSNEASNWSSFKGRVGVLTQLNFRFIFSYRDVGNTRTITPSICPNIFNTPVTIVNDSCSLVKSWNSELWSFRSRCHFR